MYMLEGPLVTIHVMRGLFKICCRLAVATYAPLSSAMWLLAPVLLWLEAQSHTVELLSTS